jgi:hypothetical protein
MPLVGRAFMPKAPRKTATCRRPDGGATLADARATAAVLCWLLGESLIVSPYV